MIGAHNDHDARESAARSAPRDALRGLQPRNDAQPPRRRLRRLGEGGRDRRDESARRAGLRVVRVRLNARRGARSTSRRDRPEGVRAMTREAKPASLTVEFRAIGELVPYANNARTHTPAQIAQIKALMIEYGWTNPVLADTTGIIAGHGRVLAAQALYAEGKGLRLPGGLDLPLGTVPVLDCTGWSDAQRRAYIIADNKSALNAEWDAYFLQAELKD